MVRIELTLEEHKELLRVLNEVVIIEDRWENEWIDNIIESEFDIQLLKGLISKLV